MFQLIGIIFVCWILWSIFKILSKGATKATLHNAIDFAAAHGVPRDFAKMIVENPSIMNNARDVMVKHHPNFATLDVYEQYGRAIIMMYEGAESEEVLKM